MSDEAAPPPEPTPEPRPEATPTELTPPVPASPGLAPLESPEPTPQPTPPAAFPEAAHPWWKRPWWRWRGWRRPWIWIGVGIVLLGVAALIPFWRLASQFDDITFRQPSRLLSQPAVLAVGRPASADDLIDELNATGYVESSGEGALPSGCYRRTEGGLAVDLRRFTSADGATVGGLLEVALDDDRRVAGLKLAGAPVATASLEPALLHTYYGPTMLERRPLHLADFSQDLVAAVLAAEDDSFYRHAGVAPSSILRAMWVNARGGGVRQGGSTLTQQLVKNLYLSNERTLWRKGQELILALVIELRYSKREILEAYLNEIYMGSLGGVNLTGMQAAARAYFGKDAADLSLAEAATLAAMIPSPAKYSPLVHPKEAKARRNFVLDRLGKLGRVDPVRLERALAAPVDPRPEPPVRRRAPYFADAMLAEAESRFKLENLEDAGYTLYSTVSWRDQQAAQKAVDEGLHTAERGYERGNKTGTPLQAALVSVDPKTGGILAYLGGRHYEQSQFDRAGQAKRQVGSTFKPIVYAAAFEARKINPTTQLEDTPLTVRQPGLEWSPKNDDGEFHGAVTARRALEHSYNVATARLAQQVGMEHIVDLAHRMGIEADMAPFPSIALGAVEVAPVELARVYATLAGGGVRPPVHGLVAVRDRFGKPLQGTPLQAPERVLSPQSTYLVTSLMQGVIAHGTGYGAASGIRGDVAGKTGTTNRRRDTWFAGFSPERATVVWVGYDDNSATRLSGARAALPIWNRFTAAVAPAVGYSRFRMPPGLTTAVIDPTTGLLATGFCPYKINEVFRPGEAPQRTCDQHTTLLPEGIAGLLNEDGEPVFDSDERGRMSHSEPAEEPQVNGLRRFLRRLFGSRPPSRPEPPSRPPEEEH